MVAAQKHLVKSSANTYMEKKNNIYIYFEIPAKANAVNSPRHSSELNNHSARILRKETADLQVKTNQLKEKLRQMDHK